MQAEKEFKRLLTSTSKLQVVSRPQTNRIITSGEGQIKEVVPTINTGTNYAPGTIDREYQNFEAEELGIEQDVASKIRLLGKEKKSASIDRSEALLQLNMKSKDQFMYNQQTPLNVNSFNELLGVNPKQH